MTTPENPESPVSARESRKCPTCDGRGWNRQSDPWFDPMPDEDIEHLAIAVGIHPRHVRFIVDRAEQRVSELLNRSDDE